MANFAHWISLELYAKAKTITPNVAYFVPRNTDPKQLASLAGKGNLCEVEQNYLQGYLKALTAYYGELVDPALAIQAEEEEDDSDDSDESDDQETSEQDSSEDDSTVASDSDADDNQVHAAGGKRSMNDDDTTQRKARKTIASEHD